MPVVAKRSQIAPGTTRKVEAGGVAILLCNVDGSVYAIEDVCTHDGGELDQGELDGCRIMCPRHGAFFERQNGRGVDPAGRDPRCNLRGTHRRRQRQRRGLTKPASGRGTAVRR